MKKLISIVLVLAMACCFAVSAFAADSTGDNGGTVIDNPSKPIVVNGTTTIDGTQVGLPAGSTVTVSATVTSSYSAKDVAVALNNMGANISNATLVGVLDISVSATRDGADISNELSGKKFDLTVAVSSELLQNGGSYVVANLVSNSVYNASYNNGYLTIYGVTHNSPFAILSGVGYKSSGSSDNSTTNYTVCPACGYHNWTLVEGKGYVCDHCGYVRSTTATTSTSAAGTVKSPKTSDVPAYQIALVLMMAGCAAWALRKHEEK